MQLSIIIPAYNVEAYIDAALASVFAQDACVHEVIVIDDGSTDATYDKVKRYTERAELKLVSTENKGLGPARNEGLRHATGDYVYFFDSDDLLDPRFLTTIVSTVRENREPDIVLFSGQPFQDKGPTGTSSHDLMRPFAVAGLDGNQAVARLVRAGTPSPSACLYVSKRNLWRENRLSFKPIVHEDDELFLKLLLAASNIVVLQDTLFYRRLRANSIMSSGKTLKNAQGLLAATLTLVELYQSSTGRPAETRRAIRKRAIRTAQRYMRVCRKVGAKVDVKQMRHCAFATRSPQLVLSVGTGMLMSLSGRPATP